MIDIDDLSDYAMCMHKAGAEIHSFEHFGDYQGTWVAKVTYNGDTGWVSGSYGSCSGCDAFEAEFDYFDTKGVDADKLDKRYAGFGRHYLNAMMDQTEAELELTNGYGEEGALDYVRNNPL